MKKIADVGPELYYNVRAAANPSFLRLSPVKSVFDAATLSTCVIVKQ